MRIAFIGGVRWDIGGVLPQTLGPELLNTFQQTCNKAIYQQQSC